MLAGALIGAALVLHAVIYYPLLIALVILACGAAITRAAGRSDPAWVRSD